MNNIEKFVIDWNSRFPIDRWWREKHNVAFMSKQHQEINFLNQLFEFYEDRLVNQTLNEKEEDKYTPNLGDFIKLDDVNKDSLIQNLSDEFNKEFLNDG